MFTVGGLFSGIGGIETGFEKAGFKISWSNENDPYSVRSFKYNYKHQLYSEDIRKLNFKKIKSVDVLVGGFPCQAFSVAGYQKGFKDPRGNLFFEICRAITELPKMPKVLMLENSIYSVISPEGCAAILWRDPSKSLEAAKAMKLTANELLNIGIIDKVIDEAVGGAHRNKEQIIFNIKKELKKSLEEFENYTGEEVFMLREKKFLDIGKEKSFTLISKDYANLITKNNFITFIKKNYLKYKNRNIIFFLLLLAVILYLIK